MSDLTPSEKALIAEMADVLLAAEIDLGDERAVEAALHPYWEADIDQHMHAAIDRARALRAENREFAHG